MSNLDFLEGETPQEPVAPVEAVEAHPEPTSGPIRGPDGKFASAQAPSEAPPAPEPAAIMQQPEQRPEPGHIPITALLEERDKRKALEARVAAFEAQQPQPQSPDRYEDPEGYEAWREQQVEARLETQRLDMSERFARKEHGAELVDQAKAWALNRFSQDPLFHQQVLASPDPYEFAVTEFKRDQVLSQFQPSDYDQFLAWKASNGAGQVQPVAPVAIPQSPLPPRSLASAPAAGSLKPGEQPVGPGVAFDAVFSKG